MHPGIVQKCAVAITIKQQFGEFVALIYTVL